MYRVAIPASGALAPSCGSLHCKHISTSKEFALPRCSTMHAPSLGILCAPGVPACAAQIVVQEFRGHSVFTHGPSVHSDQLMTTHRCFLLSSWLAGIISPRPLFNPHILQVGHELRQLFLLGFFFFLFLSLFLVSRGLRRSSTKPNNNLSTFPLPRQSWTPSQPTPQPSDEPGAREGEEMSLPVSCDARITACSPASCAS